MLNVNKKISQELILKLKLVRNCFALDSFCSAIIRSNFNGLLKFRKDLFHIT